MPRVTRAALRSVEQQDGSGVAATIPLPPTPIKDRVPLGETTGNKGAHSEAANASEEKVAPVRKGPGKGKKGNATKRANQKTKDNAEELRAGVLEDGSQSIHSPAAEEASQDLLKDDSQGKTQVLFDDGQPQTPPSAAAITASRELSPKPTTPHLGSEMHKSHDMTDTGGKDEQEDSFVAKIESRTPLRMTNSEGSESPLKGESDKDDSFVEQIKARTPGKRISRIEDSVEALDALEEEIEKVGGLIPAGTGSIPSRVKAKEQPKLHSITMDSDLSGSVKTQGSDKQSKGEVRRRTSVPRPPSRVTSSNTKPRLRRGTTVFDPCIETQAAGPSHNVRQATSQAILKKRLSSVHKAPFQPTKSTKPPTRPNFELPGDAIARKLKEQREERSKREEEEAAKPRVFKARPVRLSHAPEVKLTATTKARLSMAKGEPINKIRPSIGLDDSKPAARPRPVATANTSQRFSSVSVGKRATQRTADRSTHCLTSGSARLTRGPSLSAPTSIRAPSVLGRNSSAPAAEESAYQKPNGKEVFGRIKAEIAEREKAKKEKEDAARKARAEAAERGRIASRAWAEKQKARKLAAGKVNEEAKGIAA